MRQRATWLVVAMVALWGAAASGGDQVADRIARVEHGLVPGVQLGAAPGWTVAERMAHHGVPGLAVAVISDGAVEWSRQYGVSDAVAETPVTEKTLFQVASITKPFLAVVALKLVEQGVLDLDRDVNAYLKSWKVPDNELTKKEKVTLRRLLSHSAGLTVSGFRGYADGEPVPTVVQILDGLPPANSDPVRVAATPGSGFRYSGGGYMVAQQLIEDVTGRPLVELVEEMVLEPLGMERSSLRAPLPATLAPWRAMAHRRDGVPFPGHDFAAGGSACCGLWTTAGDLAKFAVGLQRSLSGEPGGVLSPATARLMATPANSPNMALGLFLQELGGEVYLEHSGGNPGFVSRLLFHPSRGYGVAVVTNSGGGGLMDELIGGIAGEYGWPGLQPRRFTDAAALLTTVRELVRSDPSNPMVGERGLNGLGYELVGSGQGEAAVGVFEMAVELFPDSANVRDSLAEAYEAQGRFGEALATYRAAIELLEKDPERNRGYARQRETTIAKIAALEAKTRQAPQ